MCREPGDDFRLTKEDIQDIQAQLEGQIVVIYFPEDTDD